MPIDLPVFRLQWMVNVNRVGVVDHEHAVARRKRAPGKDAEPGDGGGLHNDGRHLVRMCITPTVVSARPLARPGTAGRLQPSLFEHRGFPLVGGVEYFVLAAAHL